MFALVQVEDFDQGELYARLKQSADEKAYGNTGAIVTFTGLVRDFNNAGDIDGIELEHYPGMTEKALMLLWLNKRANVFHLTVLAHCIE